MNATESLHCTFPKLLSWFQIVLKPGGEAELRARKALNCEKRKNYKFDIAAVACTGEVSDK
jgi:hypothetical protein